MENEGVLSEKRLLCLGVREEVASNDWKEMSGLLNQTPPSNHGFIGFFYDDHEILPQNIQGRFYFNAEGQSVDNLEAPCKARAVLEGQCLAKRLYLQRANVDLANNVNHIVITGKINRLKLQ
jgi:xylulokinase